MYVLILVVSGYYNPFLVRIPMAAWGTFLAICNTYRLRTSVLIAGTKNHQRVMINRTPVLTPSAPTDPNLSRWDRPDNAPRKRAYSWRGSANHMCCCWYYQCAYSYVVNVPDIFAQSWVQVPSWSTFFCLHPTSSLMLFYWYTLSLMSSFLLCTFCRELCSNFW